MSNTTLIEPAALSTAFEALNRKVLRMEARLEDLEDLRDLDDAIERNGTQPAKSWESAKALLDLE